MTFYRVAAVAALVAGVGAGLSGCGSARAALGMTKVTPDEFRVVTKAPLVVPPDYALRPPAPGEPRPQELQPESAAREALLGQQQAVQRSDGEKLLVAKAGGDKADPLIRFVVDDEFGHIAHKDKGFADFVMFWRKDKPDTQTRAAMAQEAGAADSNPIDPAVEADRVKRLTDNRPVVIEREKTGGRIKLPGL
jgi:hypothetical protein